MTVRIDDYLRSETYRHCLQARVAQGGACSLLVRRVNGRIELLHHATWEGCAVLTDAQATELAAALTAAVQTR